MDSHWVVEDVHRRWSRVRVLDSPEPRRCDAPVRVLHVDYGHVTHVATRQLRHLMPQAAAQPYAALFCKLVDVRPTGTSVNKTHYTTCSSKPFLLSSEVIVKLGLLSMNLLLYIESLNG